MAGVGCFGIDVPNKLSKILLDVNFAFLGGVLSFVILWTCGSLTSAHQNGNHWGRTFRIVANSHYLMLLIRSRSIRYYGLQEAMGAQLVPKFLY